MNRNYPQINWHDVPTPCYVVDEKLIIRNLEILKSVYSVTNCRILLAQKGFSMFSLYPLIGEYLHGTTASSLFEAKLGYEEMPGREVHIYAPAYRDDDFEEILTICDHIVFNSFAQWHYFKDRVHDAQKSRHISCGIRVNPEYSEIEKDIYNPCFENSRLGTTLANFEAGALEGIDGLHFHTLCEQNSDTLQRTLDIFEQRFGVFLPQMRWVNFGGGHHITRPDYNLNILIDCINRIQSKYGVTVYLEPGEAVALNTGFLVSEVLDILKNNMNLAIMDTSAACHMPDVLEMPYRPEIIGAGNPGEKPYTYRLGGPTCLAGDIIGDYSFDTPLKPKDRLIFCDMAHYSMVKNNTFNGMNLPAIILNDRSDQIRIIRSFGYADFKNRLS